MRYLTMAFLQDSEAEEYLERIKEEGPEEVLRELAAAFDGGDPGEEPREDPPWGSHDEYLVDAAGFYALSWNQALGHVGLACLVPDAPKPEDYWPQGPGVKYLGSPDQKWYGGGYCGVCGDTGHALRPRHLTYWDEGWRYGVLCRHCLAEAAERGPEEEDPDGLQADLEDMGDLLDGDS